MMQENVRIKAGIFCLNECFGFDQIFLFIMKDRYALGASCESHDFSSAVEEKTLKKRKTSTSTKKWNEGNTTLLIDLLKERPSLWDMLDSKYTKHEVVK